MTPRETNVSQCTFEGHSETAIKVNRGGLRITDTRISGGSGSGVDAQFANVTMINVTMRDSSNQAVQGKGLFCICHQVFIDRSNFSNLEALEGGAIYLSSSHA
jgi:hypothetical protein